MIKVKYWKTGMVLDREVFDKAIAKEAEEMAQTFDEDKICSAKRTKGATGQGKHMNEDIQIDAERLEQA